VSETLVLNDNPEHQASALAGSSISAALSAATPVNRPGSPRKLGEPQAQVLMQLVRKSHAARDRMVEPHLHQPGRRSEAHQPLRLLPRHADLARDLVLRQVGDVVEPPRAGGSVQTLLVTAVQAESSRSPGTMSRKSFQCIRISMLGSGPSHFASS
jgi:hypothetical protein